LLTALAEIGDRSGQPFAKRPGVIALSVEAGAVASLPSLGYPNGAPTKLLERRTSWNDETDRRRIERLVAEAGKVFPEIPLRYISAKEIASGDKDADRTRAIRALRFEMAGLTSSETTLTKAFSELAISMADNSPAIISLGADETGKTVSALFIPLPAPSPETAFRKISGIIDPSENPSPDISVERIERATIRRLICETAQKTGYARKEKKENASSEYQEYRRKLLADAYATSADVIDARGDVSVAEVIADARVLMAFANGKPTFLTTDAIEVAAENAVKLLGTATNGGDELDQGLILNAAISVVERIAMPPQLFEEIGNAIGKEKKDVPLSEIAEWAKAAERKRERSSAGETELARLSARFAVARQRRFRSAKTGKNADEFGRKRLADRLALLSESLALAQGAAAGRRMAAQTRDEGMAERLLSAASSAEKNGREAMETALGVTLLPFPSMEALVSAMLGTRRRDAVLLAARAIDALSAGLVGMQADDTVNAFLASSSALRSSLNGPNQPGLDQLAAEISALLLSAVAITLARGREMTLPRPDGRPFFFKIRTEPRRPNAEADYRRSPEEEDVAISLRSAPLRRPSLAALALAFAALAIPPAISL
jgi:hypothetical protein